MMVVYSIDSPVSPAPRLMARSMLSLGTDVFFAFCTASTSVGLPERSAPPILAATSMFLMSLANDFARRWSMTAFLCLVVAHLECPDMMLLNRFAAGASADEPLYGSGRAASGRRADAAATGFSRGSCGACGGCGSS